MFKMMNKHFYIRNLDMKHGKYLFTKSLKKSIKKVDEVGYVFLQITAFIDLKRPFSCSYYTQFATLGL